MRRIPVAAFLALVCCTCAIDCTSRAETPVAISIEAISRPVQRPGAPWPRTAAPCVIPNAAQPELCGPPIEVVPFGGQGEPFAVVSRRSFARVEWSDLPVLGGPRFARVKVVGEGIHVEGWASLDGQPFSMTRRVALSGEHVWAPPRAEVAILGTHGDAVAVRVATPFTAPSAIEALVPCSIFGDAKVNVRVVAGPPFARATKGRLALRSSAHGPVVFTMDVDPERLWVWRERADDAVHIAGGQLPWEEALGGDTPLLFDGWVEADEVVRVDKSDSDRDSGCDMPDIDDLCPGSAGPKIDATIYGSAEPTAEAIGTIDRGTSIALGETRGAFVAFTTVNGVVAAPKGHHFWMKSADAEGACSTSSTLDGCPACPP